MSQSAHNRDLESRAEVTLLQRIAKGEQKALADLYDKHRRLVYSLVLNTVGTQADAEEVTQEVFLKVWQNAGSYKPAKGSPMAWIVTIARRQAIDRTRSRGYKFQKRSTELDEAVVEGTQAESLDDPTETMMAGLRDGAVRKTIAGLNPNHQRVINLAYYKGMSHSEIAQYLDIPLGTVKGRLREAVSQLRRAMDA